MSVAARRLFLFETDYDGAPAPYHVEVTTPAMEKRIMELMPEDAKAALLLLARQLPYEFTQALERIEGRRS